MAHCGRYEPGPLTRRDMLRGCACGFGAMAFAGMFASIARAAGGVDAGAGVLAHMMVGWDLIRLWLG